MAYIAGYGVYIPKYRIKTEEIASLWGRDAHAITQGLMISEKSVWSQDEDTVTMGVEAASYALNRAQIDPGAIGALYCGSETPAYAVKPNATIIGNALGIGPFYQAADMQFACKAGTAALQVVMASINSNLAEYGLAIGADTAEYNSENIGDHTCGAGSGAFILGNDPKNALARIVDTVSFSSDMPDFWRRPQQRFPIHAERFTGEPAYLKHTLGATKRLLERTKMSIPEIDHAIFHTPNGKFPLKAGKLLGLSMEQLKAGFVVDKIANTYSAAALIGLAGALDVAKPGQHILVTSYGSGAGSDSFLIEVLEGINSKRALAPSISHFLDDKEYLDYKTYAKQTGRII